MFGIIFSFVASQILYFALHLKAAVSEASFARDEIAAFEAMKNGDMAAQDYHRHNLRLVAHIVKIHASSTDRRTDQHRNHRPYQGGETAF